MAIPCNKRWPECLEEQVDAMPMYTFKCVNDHQEDVFVSTYLDKECVTPVCKECSHSMGQIIALGTRFQPLFYSEKRPRVDWNLGPEPVTITSEAQHQRLMKERGLTLAGHRRGEKGCW